MKKLRLTAVLSLVALLAACAGASKLDVKVGNKDMPLNVKGSGTYSSTKTFTETKDGQSKITKAASNYVVLANYDIDTSSGMNSMGKAVTAADQIRVSFQLVGEEGTDDKTGFQNGHLYDKGRKIREGRLCEHRIFCGRQGVIKFVRRHEIVRGNKDNIRFRRLGQR
ncbi:MAG: hypothetical protein IPJ30_15200 [Acidobacteria bacterium]|nr:hypothetical protein [Acidobacteriota bacterium]